MLKKKGPETIDEYIAAQPEQVRGLLERLRTAIRQAVPGAEEVISYQMPAFRLKGVLVFFAAFKNHIGFYPTSSGIKAFRKELASYETSKGAIRFPLDKPLPIALVKKIVKFRVSEQMDKG